MYKVARPIQKKRQRVRLRDSLIGTNVHPFGNQASTFYKKTFEKTDHSIHSAYNAHSYSKIIRVLKSGVSCLKKNKQVILFHSMFVFYLILFFISEGVSECFKTEMSLYQQ